MCKFSVHRWAVNTEPAMCTGQPPNPLRQRWKETWGGGEAKRVVEGMVSRMFRIHELVIGALDLYLQNGISIIWSKM